MAKSQWYAVFAVVNGRQQVASKDTVYADDEQQAIRFYCWRYGLDVEMDKFKAIPMARIERQDAEMRDKIHRWVERSALDGTLEQPVQKVESAIDEPQPHLHKTAYDRNYETTW